MHTAEAEANNLLSQFSQAEKQKRPLPILWSEWQGAFAYAAL